MSADKTGDLRIKTASGETYIAATQRADGTWRKPRKVKTNYIPQEEQPKYESPAQQMMRLNKQALKYPIGLSPVNMQKNILSAGPSTTILKKPVAAIEKPNAAITPQDHIQKKINNLKKKLDDIEKLKKKIESGDLKNPEKTQIEKIKRSDAINEEIEKLTEQMNNL